MQNLIYQTLIFIVLLIAFFETGKIIAGDNIYGVGTRKLRSLKSKGNKRISIWEKKPLRNLLVLVGSILVLEPEQERQEAEQLKRAGYDYSPREFKARLIIYFSIGLICSGLMYLYGLLIVIPVVLVWTVQIIFKTQAKVKGEIQKNNDEILMDLPQFVESIISGVEIDQDIIGAIERYIPLADLSLKTELENLHLEMNIIGVQRALTQFEIRMGIPEISRLVTILVNLERGIPQGRALETLSSDMTLQQSENITSEYAKRPGQLMVAAMPCAVVVIVMFVYVFLMEAKGSFNFL